MVLERLVRQYVIPMYARVDKDTYVRTWTLTDVNGRRLRLDTTPEQLEKVHNIYVCMYVRTVCMHIRI